MKGGLSLLSESNWRKNNMYCVVMGDIINSKKIDTELWNEVNKMIKDTFNYINTVYKDSILADFGLVRGDAFEGILLTNYQVVEIVEELIKGFYKAKNTKVRICVVLGELMAIKTNRNEANGPAFYKANEGLEKLKEDKKNHWFQVSIMTDSLAQPLLDGILGLISSMTEGWTDRQRDIVWKVEELSGQQKMAGKNMGISSSVVNKQLRAANYAAYRKAWSSIRAFLTEIEEYNLKESNSFLAYYGTAQRKNKESNYQEAYNLLLMAARLAESDLEQQDPQLIMIYNAIVENRIKLKSFEEAETYVNRSLEIQNKMPKSTFLFVSTLNLKGDLLLEKNLISDAWTEYEEALDITENIADQNDCLKCNCYSKLAYVSVIEKNYNKALLYYEKDLKLHLQRDQIGIADLYYNIASCYLELEDIRKAEELYKNALSVYEKILPPKHNSIKKTKELLEKVVGKKSLVVFADIRT
jgi:Tetratricopeptide repeat.